MRYYTKILFFVAIFSNTLMMSAQKDTLKDPIKGMLKDTIKGSIDTISTIKYNRWSVYGYIGLSQIYGDIVPEYKYSPITSYNGVLSKDLFVGISWQWTKLFSVEGRFELANLASYRYKSPEAINTDSLRFQSNFFHYEVSTSFSFSNWFWPNIKNRKWNSYLILGVGFTHYRSASYFLNKNKFDKLFEYYGYEKIDDYTLKKANRQIVPSATIGIGLKYRISKHFDVGVEIVQTSVYNDRLDAYVRVLSERDKFGHTSIGLIYHFERNDRTLVWDFPSEYNQLISRIDTVMKNQLCDCPIIKTTVNTIDSITKEYTIINNRTDSIFVILEKERGPDTDNDKIPDYRDLEPNSAIGAWVDSKGITIKSPEILPVSNSNVKGQANASKKAYDSLVMVVNHLKMIIDTLVRYRELERGPDIDNDKVPDYRDSEPNSPLGSVVNTLGVAILLPNDIHNSINSPNYLEPRMVVIKGVIQNEDKVPIEAQVDVVDKAKNDIVASFETNALSGKYVISLPAGKEYSFVVKAKGYAFYSETIVISDTTKAKVMEKGISMIKLEAGKRIVLRNIFYDFNKSTLRPESNVELANLLDLLNTNPTLKIEISGHTDNIGSAKYNKKLSESRAQSVVTYLIQKGITKERLVSAGYGFDQPIAPNETDEGRQLNRRTEFKILNN
jgi:outer membrane protein OmpA-like peptidoglycan-associated protein